MGYTSSDPGYVSLSSATDVTFKLGSDFNVRVRKYITDYNEKYNDGTVPTFTPEERDAYFYQNSPRSFDTALGSVYHTEMVSGVGKYRTINFWQNSTPDMLPVIASGSLHDQVKETETDGARYQNNYHRSRCRTYLR